MLKTTCLDLHGPQHNTALWAHPAGQKPLIPSSLRACWGWNDGPLRGVDTQEGFDGVDQLGGGVSLEGVGVASSDHEDDVLYTS